MLDAVGDFAVSLSANDARGPLSSLTSCDSYFQIPPEFKFASGWGGARPGAGRPRKAVRFHPPSDIFRWYVARTYHGQTELAARELRLADYTIFAPTIFRPATPPRRGADGHMRPGKPDRVEYLFVRYIFVSLNLADPDWHKVKTVEGVERIISSGHLSNNMIGIPIAVPDQAIAWIREMLGPNDCLDFRELRAKPIPAGTRLRLIDGPLPDRVGVCQMSDGARVQLLVNMLGREVRLTVAQSAVEPL
jgi:transcriptional antiterminator RfaH